tara:strand:+ start:78 stop:434 length:357 start_codon:yes stop_codon:yes gene_type:complete
MCESSYRDTGLAKKNKLLRLDAEGFLKRLDDWDESVASAIAANEGIFLKETHWKIIYLLRAFYSKHSVAPSNRAFVSLVKRELGADKGQSRYLMGMFGGSPAKTAAKVAGLPKPENCL